MSARVGCFGDRNSLHRSECSSPSPIPANLLLVGLIVPALRRLDEFLRHVHFEAIAIGFMLTGLAVFIYGYLQMARAVPPLNFGIVWLFMVLFYGIGYVIAARHYR